VSLSPRARLTGDHLVLGIDVGSTTEKVMELLVGSDGVIGLNLVSAPSGGSPASSSQSGSGTPAQ